MIDPTKIHETIREKMESEMLHHLKLEKLQELSEKEAMKYVRPRVQNPEDRSWLKRNKDQVPFRKVGKSRIYLGIYIAQFKLYGEAAWLLWGRSPPGMESLSGEANTMSGSTGLESSGFPSDQEAKPGIAPGTTNRLSKPAALASALRTLR